MSGRPTNAPDWATNANFAAGIEAWNAQANKLLPPAGKIAEGFDPDEDFFAEWFNWILNNHGQWINYIATSIGLSCFGDGSDGSVVLDGVVAAPSWATKSGTVYTLARDTALLDLTITGAGVVVKTANFRLIGAGTLTTTAGGTVNNNGAASGFATAPAGSLGAGAGGVNGILSGAGGVAGSAGGAAANSAGGNGGAGGAGGTAGGGAGGVATAPAANLGSLHVFGPVTVGYIFSRAATGVWTQVQGGASGGVGGVNAGSGSSANSGGGAGVTVIAFPNLALANSTDISCVGGAAADSTLGTSTAVGGSGGGGGGLLILIYASKGASSFSAAVNCAGGAGGAGKGTGVNGSPGATGQLIEFSLSDSTSLPFEASSAHTEKGFAAITSGSGAGHDYVDVSWTAPFAAATGASGYEVDVQISLTTDGDPIPGVAITNKTPTGFRIRFTTDFDGEVRWSAK